MKALIISGPLHQDHELIYPFYRLLEAGFQVDVGSYEMGDFTGIVGLRARANVCVDWDLSVHDYDLLVIPGGVKCMEKLRLTPAIVGFIEKFHAKGGLIGSICSGAQMLISAGLCKGRVISAYPAMRVDVENAGGEFRNEVVNFDRIVSAPHYRDLPEFMKALLAAYEKERTWRNEICHV
jgi:protease I